jgi:hypothetical protein
VHGAARFSPNGLSFPAQLCPQVLSPVLCCLPTAEQSTKSELIVKLCMRYTLARKQQSDLDPSHPIAPFKILEATTCGVPRQYERFCCWTVGFAPLLSPSNASC